MKNSRRTDDQDLLGQQQQAEWNRRKIHVSCLMSMLDNGVIFVVLNLHAYINKKKRGKRFFKMIRILLLSSSLTV